MHGTFTDSFDLFNKEKLPRQIFCRGKLFVERFILFFDAVFLGESLECGEGAQELVLAYAIGKSYVTADAEIVARNDKQFLCLCLFIKGEGVVRKGLYHKIKGAVGLYTFVSEIGESVIYNITVLAVSVNVYTRVDAPSDHSLEKAWRADVAERSSRAANSEIYAF